MLRRIATVACGLGLRQNLGGPFLYGALDSGGGGGQKVVQPRPQGDPGGGATAGGGIASASAAKVVGQ